MARWCGWVVRGAMIVVRDRRAQDMVEYALLAGFVAVAVGAAIPYTAVPAISHIYSKLSTVCLSFAQN